MLVRGDVVSSGELPPGIIEPPATWPEGEVRYRMVRAAQVSFEGAGEAFARLNTNERRVLLEALAEIYKLPENLFADVSPDHIVDKGEAIGWFTWASTELTMELLRGRL